MYGDYELISEIAASRIAEVHLARKQGRQYVLKRFRPLLLAEEERYDHGDLNVLGEDLHLKFLEAAKIQKKAADHGARRCAPIHDAGHTGEGAWYVTDHYPRGSLKRWIQQRTTLDTATLRKVLANVLAALLDLQRLTGRSHGNLKPANILLGGGLGAPLGRTPIFLTDLRAGAAADAPMIELHDLRALGEVILQLVTGREISGPDEYNYPIEPSPAWNKLGDKQRDWLELCNRLVNPKLSLQSCTLASLAREIKPPKSRMPSWRAIPPRVWKVAAAVGGALALAGVLWGWLPNRETRYQEALQVQPHAEGVGDRGDATAREAEAQRLAAQKAAQEFKLAWGKAEAAEQAGQLSNALVLYQQAQRLQATNAQVAAKIKALTARVEARAREAEAQRLAAQKAAQDFKL
ncbi:MAG: hypothetical protein JXQ71_02850, partial [Verrucomicrobia bacterium]|nr:hypothetical protein [Verrucomicrobiota bacterium]